MSKAKKGYYKRRGLVKRLSALLVPTVDPARSPPRNERKTVGKASLLPPSVASTICASSLVSLPSHPLDPLDLEWHLVFPTPALGSR